MMPSQEKAKKPYGILRVFSICAGISIVITLLLLAAMALLVSSGTVPGKGVLPLVIAAECTGVVIGSRMAARQVKSHKMLSGLAVSVVVLFLLLTLGLPFAYPLGRHALLCALFILLSGAVGGFWGAQKKPRKVGV